MTGSVVPANDVRPAATRVHALFAEIKSGRSLRQIAEGDGGPKIVDLKAVWALLKKDPLFGQQAIELLNAHKKRAIVAACKARPLRVTHCPKGHEFTPENTRHYTVRKYGWNGRECVTCRREWVKRGRPTAEQLERVADAVRNGATLGQVTSHKKGYGKRIVKFYALRTAFAQNPSLERELRAISKINEKRARLAIGEKARQRWQEWRASRPVKPPKQRIRKTPRIALVRSPLHALNEPGVDVMIAARAATASVWGGIRDEVEALMLLAYYEGQIRIDEFAARVREFISAANKEHPTRYAPPSLDAMSHPNGVVPLIEKLSFQQWADA